MNKEFGYTGSEYSNAGEIHQPQDPLNHFASEITEGRDEYWCDPVEYTEELQKETSSASTDTQKQHSKDLHKKVVRKMVYAVASAVTVVSLAQVATPSEGQSVITNFENALDQLVSPVVTSAPHEPLLAAQTIVFSGSGILTKEDVEEELEKYDLSENFAVIIEDGYTEIAPEAFNNLDTLVSVSIPNSVTVIGHEAFCECRNLVIDTLDTTGLTIGGHAFRYVTINEIIISETFNCAQSMNQPSLANTNIKNVNFESGITTVPAYTLYNCKGITSIDIPNSVTTINMCAFTNIEDLASITLPDSVNNIGESAFDRCENLVIESLSTKERTIGSYAFRYVTIEEVIISETFDCMQNTNSPSLSHANIQKVSFEQGITNIPAAALCESEGFTSVTIPGTVISIGNSAFERCYSMTDITLPNNLTTIGRNAFEQCSNLISVNIPDSVTEIGDEAFDGCENLVFGKFNTANRTIGTFAFRDVTIKDVIISDTFNCAQSHQYPSLTYANIQNISFEQGITSIPAYALSRCSTITSLDIPDTVTTIGADAFYECASLTDITLPDSVTTIESNAFRGCSGLVIDVLNTSGRTIGTFAFRDVTIKDVIISDTFNCAQSHQYPSLALAHIQNISFEQGITSIPAYALSRCSTITSVDIPDTVTTIGADAFYECTALTDITLPDSVTTIESNAFRGCSGLVIDELNTSGRTIGTFAFQDVTIKDVIISDTFNCAQSHQYPSLTYANIQNISFEQGITSIPAYALSRCSTITSLDIPDTVTTIGTDAFYECAALTDVTLPNSITTIEGGAFKGCPNLTLHVSGGSAAEEYALEENIPYITN